MFVLLYLVSGCLYWVMRYAWGMVAYKLLQCKRKFKHGLENKYVNKRVCIES